jgi:Arc/MetJ-type ribon-helix-helix transcriptional regulator
MIKTKSNWATVKLPRIIVEDVEREIDRLDSDYTSVGSFVAQAVRTMLAERRKA